MNESISLFPFIQREGTRRGQEWHFFLATGTQHRLAEGHQQSELCAETGGVRCMLRTKIE